MKGPRKIINLKRIYRGCFFVWSCSEDRKLYNKNNKNNIVKTDRRVGIKKNTNNNEKSVIEMINIQWTRVP